MKKILNVAIIFLWFAAGLSAQALDEEIGKYYKVVTDLGAARAKQLVVKMDAYFEFYNSYFHFSTAALENRLLNVRIYNTKGAYDRYLLEKKQTVRNSFSYIQYTDPSLNEVVGYWAQDQKLLDIYFAHYSLLQFLSAFYKHPPLWLRLGFATYFEKCYYNQASGRIVFKENLDWLKSLKDYFKSETGLTGDDLLLALNSALSLDLEGANNNLEAAYSQSWGLVYFLRNTTNREYQRVMWDIFRFMKKEASEEENIFLINQNVFGWVAKDQFVEDYANFITSVKTYEEWVSTGLSYFNESNYNQAIAAFLQAIGVDEDGPFPYYYLGLIYYYKESYSDAETYYRQYLSKGGDAGIGNYALGLNAQAAGQMERARAFMQLSLDTEPDGKFSRQAREFIERLQESGDPTPLTAP